MPKKKTSTRRTGRPTLYGPKMHRYQCNVTADCYEQVEAARVALAAIVSASGRQISVSDGDVIEWIVRGRPTTV